MPDNQRYITFLTPTMQRTGSEIVLFNLLSRISKKYIVKVVSVYNGSLLAQLNKKQEAIYIHNERPHVFFDKLKFKLKELFFIPRILKACEQSIWYINTIVLWDYLEYAEKHQIKVILHVHELEHIFDLMSKEQLVRVVNYPDLIIANSQYTSQLVQSYGRIKPIELCYPAIDTNQVKSNHDIRITYRKKINISDDSFIWAMCGTLDENKNPDLFIDIASELIKKKPHSVFLWIGGTQDTAFYEKCKNRAIQKNVSDYMIWVNSVGEEYMNYFNCADGFVLTSKKESFSIVTLEALLLGIPVVTHNCGGVKEILRDDVGIIVKEKNSVSQFVEAMSTFMDNHKVFDKMKGIERANEFDIAIWSKKWNSILDNYID